MKKNKHLQEPEILSRISELRKKLIDTDDPSRLVDWEVRAKKALITLSLKGHEGIGILIEKAKDEISYRQNKLKMDRPVSLSAEESVKYASNRSFDFAVIDLWTWFWQLFVSAESELQEIESYLKTEETVEEESLTQDGY